MLRTVLLSFLLTTTPLCAVTLSLEDAAPYALVHNRELKAARLRIDAAKGRLKNAGRLPNPELEIEYLNSTRSGELELNTTFMQRFPVTARLRLEKQISLAQLAQAKLEIANEERNLAANVRATVIRILGLEGERRFLQKQIETSRELVRFSQSRVATGEISTLDVLQLELELKQLEAEFAQTDVELALLMGELRPMLGLSPTEPLKIRGGLPPVGRFPHTRSSEVSRADLLAARTQAAAAQKGVALAKAEKWQDIGLGIVGELGRSDEEPGVRRKDYFVGFRLNVPLPLWNDQSGRVQEARAEALRAQKEAEALENTIRLEADAALVEIRRQARLVKEYDATLIPKSEEVERALDRAYSAGQVPLVELIRARSRTLQLKRQREATLRGYHLARIRYEAAVAPALQNTTPPHP